MSYILSSFMVVYDGRVGMVPVTLLYPEVEILQWISDKEVSTSLQSISYGKVLKGTT